MTGTDFKKWLAIGTGAGIEIGPQDLNVTVVRVRPNGAKVLGEITIERFRECPASDWGADYKAFLKKLGGTHLSATVLLPREDVMVRQVMLPGVSDKDLESAIRFEIDSLNPYSEEEAVFDWARIGKTPSVLIGITRRTILDRYTRLFAEAGVNIASFTFAAPAIYSAVRMFSTPPEGFVALEEVGDEIEIYGEGPARPLFSTRLDQSADRARALAIAELRLPPDTQSSALHNVLPPPIAAPQDYRLASAALCYAAALAGACPVRALSVNLLPPEQRQFSSRARFVPTIVLASLALLLLGAVIAYPKYADGQYLELLQARIKQMDPQARKAKDLDRQIEEIRNRAQTLDNFRRHTKDDLDALSELTQILAPPTFLSGLQINRDSLLISGEAEQAAALLKLLDSSHQFQGSSFAVPMLRTPNGEVFNIRAMRKGVTP
jgi:hypothetical protein